VNDVVFAFGSGNVMFVVLSPEMYCRGALFPKIPAPSGWRDTEPKKVAVFADTLLAHTPPTGLKLVMSYQATSPVVRKDGIALGGGVGGMGGGFGEGGGRGGGFGLTLGGSLGGLGEGGGDEGGSGLGGRGGGDGGGLG